MKTKVYVIMIQRGWEFDEYDCSYVVVEDLFFLSKKTAEKYANKNLAKDWQTRDWFIKELYLHKEKD